MTCRPDFEQFIADAEDKIQAARVEAREMIEAADAAHDFKGTLIAEWDRRCDEASEERALGAMARAGAALAAIDESSGE